jgi:hypothetical protein
MLSCRSGALGVLGSAVEERGVEPRAEFEFDFKRAGDAYRSALEF